MKVMLGALIGAAVTILIGLSGVMAFFYALGAEH